jgi:serine/threonine-protein kinase
MNTGLVPPLTERCVGRHRLESLLGRGRTGAVYRAFDPLLGRQVAIKRVERAAPGSATAGPRSEEQQLLVEARTVARLDHPNVVAVFDAGEDDLGTYVVMELVDGESLEARMRRQPPLRLVETVRIVQQVADALAAAHARGVCHRDVKPGNVVLQDGRTPKLVDFGFSRLPPGLRRLKGLVVGTPRYLSPEQIEGKRVDARSDVFALGAMLFEMLAGRPAFDGASFEEVARQVREARCPDLRSVAPAAPRYLEGLVGRMLAREPGARYSAREVADRLSRYLRRAEAKALIRRHAARAGARVVTLGGLGSLLGSCATQRPAARSAPALTRSVGAGAGPAGTLDRRAAILGAIAGWWARR